MFDWITDPSILAGLITLIVLELVLGIDNLVFIAILAGKVPRHQQDRARIIGLLLALLLRLGLLASISWLVSFTRPLFNIASLSFSARDLIMVTGGAFLLYKGTTELNSRLEGKHQQEQSAAGSARFWPVVAQIVVLDGIFSLDSVITAVGMVDQLAVMMAAVIIAIALMLLASKPLTRFVNSHPSVVILCLSFLMMIGFSLIADGFGYAVPKGYLYAAIGFAVMIESFNQLAMFNRRRFLAAGLTMRKRTSEAVLRLLRGHHEQAELDSETLSLVADNEQAIFNRQERLMIARVMSLGQRNISSIMTSRHDIELVDLAEPQHRLRERLRDNQHTRLVVNENGGDPLGVVHIIDLLEQQLRDEPLNPALLLRQPPVFPEQLPLLQALEQFRGARTHFAFVVDEFGSVEGIVTLSDVMEAIAGNLPAEGESLDPRHDIQQNADGSWSASGAIPLEELVNYIPLPLNEKRDYHTLAGLLMENLQRVPLQNEQVTIGNFLLRIEAVVNHRIQKVSILPLAPPRQS
ncbi:hypothetical protein BTJ39_11675 [Izhakiella australiensis]|uniref:CBS domain-containing protein n=1 Tax=Izhakiella australiensis TaxID=1926881 RepID=A0A1S8YL78_9GAMM|nr:TerC family protein [Izhakiella australiensis]OON39692.1 hypothetical protein BTJ39_11675 [Izhakiella australiensis]